MPGPHRNRPFLQHPSLFTSVFCQPADHAEGTRRPRLPKRAQISGLSWVVPYQLPHPSISEGHRDRAQDPVNKGAQQSGPGVLCLPEKDYRQDRPQKAPVCRGQEARPKVYSGLLSCLLTRPKQTETSVCSTWCWLSGPSSSVALGSLDCQVPLTCEHRDLALETPSESN